MTVAELIAHLQDVEPIAEVVVFDHFGHPIHMTKDDFSFRKRTPIGESTSAKKVWYVAVSPIDIGPEPD